MGLCGEMDEVETWGQDMDETNGLVNSDRIRRLFVARNGAAPGLPAILAANSGEEGDVIFRIPEADHALPGYAVVMILESGRSAR